MSKKALLILKRFASRYSIQRRRTALFYPLCFESEKRSPQDLADKASSAAILSIYYSHTLMISDAWAYRYKNKYLQFFAILSSMLIFEERFYPLTLVIRQKACFCYIERNMPC